jgi:histidine triad (HIT) family protein
MVLKPFILKIMTDCIFCKIIAGDIPSYQIYEDDDVLAFLDITQTTKGHTLVVPKKHIRNLLEMSSDDAARLFSKMPGIASHITDKLGALGMNILQNNEEIAGQTVFHAHVHLIPRYAKDDGFKASFTGHEFDLKAIQDSLTQG